MGITLSGIASNLDVDALVGKLVALERAPLDRLEEKTKATGARVSAFGALKGLLAAFQSTLEGLGDANLGALSVATGDASIARASARPGAAPGTHTLEVERLAQAHRIHSAAFGATTDAVGTGSLAFSFGTWDGAAFIADPARPPATVAIAAGQSTLAGVRDAVNAAGIGVTAAIVNDGSGQRLVFASARAGAASSLKVTVADDDGAHGDLAGLSRLAFDPAAAAGAGRNLTQSAAAQDARFVLDGLAMTRASNTVADALEGVTLELGRGAPGSPVTVSVTRDAAAAQAAVESFVKGYNDLRKALAAWGRADPAGGSTGALAGESVLRLIESRLRAVVSHPPAGLDGSFTALSQAGVRLGSDGLLSLDGERLRAALAADPDGVRRLFAATGTASDSRIAFAGATAATQAGTWAVDVTSPARGGTLTGSAPAQLAIVAGVNDTLDLVVDGVAARVTLAAGAYADATSLAADLGARLAAAGVAASVTASGGVLAIASASRGASSRVTGAAGNAAAGLLGASPFEVAGADVAGTLGGFAATGSGALLTGATGTAVAGLSVRVASGVAGPHGTLSFARGYAASLAASLGELLGDGAGIEARVDGLASAIRRYEAQGERLQRSLDATERRLRAQFAALDALMARMNRTSDFLTQQLANLPGSSKSE